MIVGADPVGSIYSGGEDGVKPYLVEGVGEDFWPETYDPSIVDRYVTVSDKDSFLLDAAAGARPRASWRAARAGWPCTPPTRSRARSTTPAAMVAVILPDGGRSYLSKVYNDAWMRQYGFLERDEALTVGDVLRRKHDEDEIPPLLTVETHAKVRDAVALLHEHRVSQLAVVSGQDPQTVVGSVSERGLLRHAMDDPALLGAEIVRRDGAAVPGGRGRGRRARGRRAARRQARGPAGEHGRPRGGHRHARRPARVPRAVTRSLRAAAASPPARARRARARTRPTGR